MRKIMMVLVGFLGVYELGWSSDRHPHLHEDAEPVLSADVMPASPQHSRNEPPPVPPRAPRRPSGGLPPPIPPRTPRSSIVTITHTPLVLIGPLSPAADILTRKIEKLDDDEADVIEGFTEEELQKHSPRQPRTTPAQLAEKVLALQRRSSQSLLREAAFSVKFDQSVGSFQDHEREKIQQFREGLQFFFTNQLRSIAEAYGPGGGLAAEDKGTTDKVLDATQAILGLLNDIPGTSLFGFAIWIVNQYRGYKDEQKAQNYLKYLDGNQNDTYALLLSYELCSHTWTHHEILIHEELDDKKQEKIYEALSHFMVLFMEDLDHHKPVQVRHKLPVDQFVEKVGEHIASKHGEFKGSESGAALLASTTKVSCKKKPWYIPGCISCCKETY